VITWTVAVFGSWLILVIPFMRKKEQIWKRLNDDQEKAVDAWLGGMGFLVGALVLALVGWSFVFRSRLHQEGSPGFDRSWAKAVLSTWFFLLIPCLVWMYRKADVIFKNAEQRQTRQPQFKSLRVDLKERLLLPQVSEKLKGMKPTLDRGHVVTAILRDERQIPHVFILNRHEILGVYDRQSLDFRGEDIVDVTPLSEEELPAYEESRWLRLDGKS